MLIFSYLIMMLGIMFIINGFIARARCVNFYLKKHLLSKDSLLAQKVKIKNLSSTSNVCIVLGLLFTVSGYIVSLLSNLNS